ncbi:hypothetical protein [Enterobacter hormaechei]|uniref:hypothetical protein n=1 Tax=Enterobacter hormaechei TaxID=158836 RepID=UPI0005EFEB3B|nr:hypothetical protein [Enterobacter hormaechei]KJN50943.1 hypothetical protein SS36_24160 [Enterobacter hormaechei subsp. steigerwaltii]
MIYLYTVMMVLSGLTFGAFAYFKLKTMKEEFEKIDSIPEEDITKKEKNKLKFKHIKVTTFCIICSLMAMYSIYIKSMQS